MHILLSKLFIMQFLSRTAILLSFLLLSACSTTVVTDEERALPIDEPGQAQEEQFQEEPELEGEQDSDTSDTAEELEGVDEEDEEEQKPQSFDADRSSSFVAFTGKRGSTVSHEGKFEEFTFSLEQTEGGTFANAEL